MRGLAHNARLAQDDRTAHFPFLNYRKGSGCIQGPGQTCGLRLECELAPRLPAACREVGGRGQEEPQLGLSMQNKNSRFFRVSEFGVGTSSPL